MSCGCDFTECSIYLQNGETLHGSWDAEEELCSDPERLKTDFLRFREGRFSPKVMALFLGKGCSCLEDNLFAILSEERTEDPYTPELCARWDALDDAKIEEMAWKELGGFDVKLYREFREKVSSPEDIKRVDILHDSLEAMEEEGPFLQIILDFQTGHVKQEKVDW